MTEPQANPTTKELATKVVFAALQILKQKGGQAPGREVMEEIEKQVPLDASAKQVYEKSGSVKWRVVLGFYSIGCMKAGFLVKKKGTWYLTPEGEKALELGPVKLLETSNQAYRRWKAENQVNEVADDADVAIEGSQEQEATIHEIEQLAIEGGYFSPFLISKNSHVLWKGLA